VADVDVLLNGYSDPVPASVDLLLVGPTGQQAVIMSDAGGLLPVVDTDLVVDDEAAEAMSATAMTSGSYRPTDLDVDLHPDVFPAPAPDASSAGTHLSAFDGTDPNGVWQLYAVDDVMGTTRRAESRLDPAPDHHGAARDKRRRRSRPRPSTGPVRA
jgi:hypothetical protein